jgi:hypothetical protein
MVWDETPMFGHTPSWEDSFFEEWVKVNVGKREDLGVYEFTGLRVWGFNKKF